MALGNARPGRLPHNVWYAKTMPSFIPFKGLLYDTTVVSIDDVAAPPYDVVDDADRARLAAKSPYNSILVELPVDEPGDAGEMTKYERAANLISEWRSEGILKRDSEPAFYLYEMEFTDESGNRRSTTGLLGGLGISGAQEGEILPHEETMPKPKGDRLYLLRATGCNISPIWGLSLSGGLTEAIADSPKSGQVISSTDEDGVVHRLSRISDQGSIERIEKIVGATPVVIADGHHRFETSLAYRKEVRDSNGNSSGGHDFVLAFVVEHAEDQLLVRTIHRLISGKSADEIREALAGFFVLTPSPVAAASLSPETLAELGAMALVTQEGCWLLGDWIGPDPGEVAKQDSPGGGVLWELDSVRLAKALSNLEGIDTTYEPRFRNVLMAVSEGNSEAAVLIRPSTVEQISRAAHARLRMAPKTTYFHPKPRTGMVIRPVED